MDWGTTMSKATAVRNEEGTIDVNSGMFIPLSLTLQEEQAIRELLKQEDEDGLGIWRWPDDPGYIVIPSPGDDDEDGRAVIVINTHEGTSIFDWEDLRPRDQDNNLNEAANAWYEAHPKPGDVPAWYDVRPGDAWILEIDNESTTAVVSNHGRMFYTPSGFLLPENSRITAGERLYRAEGNDQ